MQSLSEGRKGFVRASGNPSIFLDTRTVGCESCCDLQEKQQEEEKGLSWPVCHSGTFPPVTSEARVPSLCKLKNATPKRFAVVDGMISIVLNL